MQNRFCCPWISYSEYDENLDTHIHRETLSVMVWPINSLFCLLNKYWSFLGTDCELKHAELTPDLYYFTKLYWDFCNAVKELPVLVTENKYTELVCICQNEWSSRNQVTRLKSNLMFNLCATKLARVSSPHSHWGCRLNPTPSLKYYTETAKA